MNQLQEKIGQLMKHRGMLMTLLIASLPIVLIQPIPAIVLDFLLSFNIALAVLVMITCMYVEKPLDFSAFPSLLLILTLYRLVLNVASTRLILSEGDAGQVIGAFAEFVAGGNVVIGMVIFIILVVIQFVVITKGATRIAEVAARFTLDAMPGKQMAIDADLNSGLIDEATARVRREEVSKEAEFYGAMDGASKFVRGDAVAGIVITLINIIGGITAGMVLLNYDIGQAVEVFVKLSIGDGLVSQIPAFIVAIASGLLVTRSGKQDALGDELVKQIFKDNKAALLASGFLLTLALTTDLPPVPLLFFGFGLVLIARVITKTEKDVTEAAEAAEKQEKESAAVPKPEKFLDLDTMELVIGYGLIRLCDVAKGGDLVDRIRMIRQQMAGELGFIVPVIRIHDSLQLNANTYEVRIKGVTVAEGECHADSYLAMDTGLASGGQLEGIPTTEPAFGMKATWISPVHKEKAESQGYQVVDATSVMATHLIEILRVHCHELITRQEVANLIDNLRTRSPRVVEDTLDANLVTMGDIQRVLQFLLRERVSVRDLETILEVVGDISPRLKGNDGSIDHEVLAEYVRMQLGRAICSSLQADDGAMHVVMLEPQLEDVLIEGLKRSPTRKSIELPPQQHSQIAEVILTELEKLITTGYSPVIVVDPTIRRHVHAMLLRQMPSVATLSTVEIPSDIKLTGESVVLMPATVRSPQSA